MSSGTWLKELLVPMEQIETEQESLQLKVEMQKTLQYQLQQTHNLSLMKVIPYRGKHWQVETLSNSLQKHVWRNRLWRI